MARVVVTRVTHPVTPSARSPSWRLLSERVQQRELLLQVARAATQRVQLLALRLQHIEQVLDLHLLRQRDPAQLVEVVCAPDVLGAYMIMPIVDRQVV